MVRTEPNIKGYYYKKYYERGFKGKTEKVVEKWQKLSGKEDQKLYTKRSIAGEFLIRINKDYNLKTFFETVQKLNLKLDVTDRKNRSFNLAFPVSKIKQDEQKEKELKASFKNSNVSIMPNYIIKVGPV